MALHPPGPAKRKYSKNNLKIRIKGKIPFSEILFFNFNPTGSEVEGLGLTIVIRILDRLDGKIWVEFEEGKGSSFYVFLPGWTDGSGA